MMRCARDTAHGMTCRVIGVCDPEEDCERIVLAEGVVEERGAGVMKKIHSGLWDFSTVEVTWAVERTRQILTDALAPPTRESEFK